MKRRELMVRGCAAHQRGEGCHVPGNRAGELARISSHPYVAPEYVEKGEVLLPEGVVPVNCAISAACAAEEICSARKAASPNVASRRIIPHS